MLRRIREGIRDLLGEPPRDPESFIEAARRAEALGDAAGAERGYLQALAIDPAHAQATLSLADVYARLGMIADARSTLEDAVKALPDDPRILYEAGRLAHRGGDLVTARRHLDASIEVASDVAAPWNMLGLVHRAGERFDEAVRCFDKALTVEAAEPHAVCNLAATHRMQGDPFTACEVLDRYAALCSGIADVDAERALALAMRGDSDAALRAAESALSIDPDNLSALKTRAHLWLLLGDFARGWPAFEVRRADTPLALSDRWPRWVETEPSPDIVLVRAEEGIGDQLMYASCLPDLFNQIGADRCVVECETRLAPLYRRSFAECEIVATADLEERFDGEAASIRQVGIASLPTTLRRAPSDFPEHGGYLRADPSAVEAWRERLDALGSGAKIGISWRGGSDAGAIRIRSAALAHWAPVFEVPGCSFVNLQYGDSAAPLDAIRRERNITVHRFDDYDPLGDLDSMAALITALDLVISIDNSTVHMGGALGAEVWTLLPYAAEWRWLRECDTTPWYPAMRLFRQSNWDDWGSVMTPVAAALRDRFGATV